jgi:hypothetical protein
VRQLYQSLYNVIVLHNIHLHESYLFFLLTLTCLLTYMQTEHDHELKLIFCSVHRPILMMMNMNIMRRGEEICVNLSLHYFANQYQFGRYNHVVGLDFVNLDEGG